MREQSPVHYIGLDIGTYKVRCVVGMLDQDGHLSIIGHGSAHNLGMRKGSVVHIDDVVEAIVQVVTEAERVSGAPIHTATVNINGAQVSGLNSRGVIAISTANRQISADDRLRVEEAASVVKLPPNKEIVQIFAKNYRVDGQDNIKDPVGMEGVRLEVDTYILTVPTPAIKSLSIALEKAKIKPTNYTTSGLAAAEAVLSRQQKEAGTLLLDIGAGTTNILVIEDGEVQHIAVLPVGGVHITNDLAIGLKTDLDIAEQVKLKYGSLKPTKIQQASVEHAGKRHQFDIDTVQMIIEARIDELLEYVDKELKKIHRSQKLPGGVVLVGGSAQLPGIEEFTKEKLQLAARIGKLESLTGLVDAVDTPEYATPVGLMLLDMLLDPRMHDGGGASAGQPNDGFFGFVDGILRKAKLK
jgi:cell division protein FtsA